ncbi:hypothetical protein [Bifidobacterium fermentum]|uniref:Homoserine kinase n=1 Tax=Bifidobacterium fermentum TaxID=3059035 RepID=A0AB39UFH0_9BIFI
MSVLTLPCPTSNMDADPGSVIWEHLGLPPEPVELDQLDHAFGAGARINKGVDSIAYEVGCDLLA